jgi:hypothetical protein
MLVVQISIGDPLGIAAGVYIIHGQVVADGLAQIGSGTTIGSFVTIGLRAGNVRGATIGRDVSIGTSAKLIGPVTIGDGRPDRRQRGPRVRCRRGHNGRRRPGETLAIKRMPVPVRAGSGGDSLKAAGCCLCRVSDEAGRGAVG